LIYIPERFALGFQTLGDDTEVIHQLAYPPAAETVVGLRYDDPALAISWPEPVTEISPRDASWPLFEAQAA
jgi:dTDP-4-dehydrorhamnose 3,5-epimerase